MDTNATTITIAAELENDMKAIAATGFYNVHRRFLEKYEEQFRNLSISNGCVAAKYWSATPSALGGFWNGCDITWNPDAQVWMAPQWKRGKSFPTIASFVDSWFRTDYIVKHLLKMLLQK